MYLKCTFGAKCLLVSKIEKDKNSYIRLIILKRNVEIGYLEAPLTNTQSNSQLELGK